MVSPGSESPPAPALPPAPPSAPPRPRPLSRWGALGPLLVALPFLFEILAKDPRGFLLFSAGMLLVVLVVQGLYWGAMRLLSARHPDKPWLWERRWSTTVFDSNWHQTLLALPLLLLGLVLLGALHVASFYLMGFYFGDSAGGNYVGIAGIAFAVALIPTDFLVGKGLHRFFLRRVRPLIRFGRVGVRLPQVPLALGAKVQVRLVSDRELSRLSRVKITLQRVREWNEADTEALVGPLIRRIEYEHEQLLDLTGHDREHLSFELEFPCTDPRQDSTVLWGNLFGTSPRCFWKLQLVRDEPGNSLHATLVLPVYATEATPAVHALPIQRAG